MIAAASTRRCLAFFAGLVAVGAIGCSTKPANVWVYIDNAGGQALEVQVDGQQAATIEPGDFAELNYPPGEHRFHITSGGQTVCDLTRNLEKSDRFGVRRKYLFNPDKNNLYGSYEVKYGGSRLEGVMEASMLSYQKDPKIRAQYEYKKLLKEIDLVSTDAWNDVTGVEYILTPPPESMLTRSGSSRRVTVLDRIDRRDYQRLAEAAKNESPTEADVDELSELLDEILAKAL
jgi:hypothetical protein